MNTNSNPVSKKVLTTFTPDSLSLIDQYQKAYKDLKDRKISRDDVVNLFISSNKTSVKKLIKELVDLKEKSEKV